jgi:hypothetical protein
MVFAALFMILSCVSAFYIDVEHFRNNEGLSFWNVMNTVFDVCSEIYLWRWVYFHEKDRLKKWVTSAGRVFVNKHGRLAVTND